MHARVAWGFAVVAVVCAVVDTAVTAAYQSLLGEQAWALHGWPLVTLATVGCAVMGALIISRYPRHPIGWLLTVASASSISLAAEAYSLWVLDHSGPGPAVLGHLAGWVSALLGAPIAITALIMICLLAPDGHLLSRRWRWVARGALAGLTSYTLGVLTVPPATFDLAQPDTGILTGILTSVGVVLLALTLVASVVSIALRLRRAQLVLRRQLLWVVASAAFLALGFVWLLVLSAVNGGEQTFASAIPLFAAYLSFPIGTAVGVLRHRLFDIDVIVNRAIVVTLATAIVAAAYVGLVVALGAAIGDPHGFWPSLLATSLVALAFQPVRRRVVRLADRLAFGAAAAPYDALADFSRRLADSPDPAMLLGAVADAAGSAVSAQAATVRLFVPRAADRVAQWTALSAAAPAGQVVELPVTEVGEELGRIVVTMPAGRALRPRDLRLLEDLAEHAAIAFRNARLSAELSQQVDELDAQTSQLVESRQRLITARDAERRRLERAMASDVLPQLAAIPPQLVRLSAGPVRPAQLTPLVTAATGALEALREITRGVFPAQLERFGLEAAIRSLLGRTGVGTLLVSPEAAGLRFDARTEATAYFCVAELLRDLDGEPVVALGGSATELLLRISGQPSRPLPLDAIRDRVDVLGGELSVDAGDGVVVEVLLPASAVVPA